MKRKLYPIIAMSLLCTTLIGGCSLTTKKDDSSESSSFSGIDVIDQRSVSTEAEEVYATEIDSDLGPNDPYPIGHTLYDNSITFTNDVAVIMHDQIVKYDPAGRKITITNQASLDSCKYAYVYYSESPSLFLFQRVTKISVDSKGYTTLTLSGVPLQSEMEKKEFLSLIDNVNEYGEKTGSDADAFEEKDDE